MVGNDDVVTPLEENDGVSRVASNCKKLTKPKRSSVEFQRYDLPPTDEDRTNLNEESRKNVIYPFPMGTPIATCVDAISQSEQNFMAMPSTSMIDEYVHKNRFLLQNPSENSKDNSNLNIDSISKIKQEEEEFYQIINNEYGDDNIWGLLSGVSGNIYEWYDFAVYGLLAAEIGAAYFPKSSEEMQLIQSFGVYAVAFLMRPLGAICFGEIGDRIAGRKNALVISIILITVPSVLMGVLPTYEKIGIAAPCLLILFRMFQGLSVGGQLAGSYVLSIEQSTDFNRGFRGSLCDASSVGGFFLASLVTNIVRVSLSEEAVNEWAWRIPFWVSLGLAPLLYFIVSNSEESKFWDERRKQKADEEIIRNEIDTFEEDVTQVALYDLLSSPFRRRQLLGMIGVLAATSSSFYMLFLYCPIYLSTLRQVLDEKEADFINLVVCGFYIMMIIISGKFSDSFPHRMDLFRIGLPGICVACPVMFGMFESCSFIGIFLAQIQFALCLAMIEGGKAAWEVELFLGDPSLSFTGVAVGHNVSSTLFGGTMPLICTYLFTCGNDLMNEYGEHLLYRLIPGFYVSTLAIISLWCISDVVRHPHDVKTGANKVRKARSLARKRERALKHSENGQGSSIESTTSWINVLNKLNNVSPKNNGIDTVYSPPKAQVV